VGRVPADRIAVGEGYLTRTPRAGRRDSARAGRV